MRPKDVPSRQIEQQLEMLNALRGAGATNEAVATIRKALKDRVNLVVAKAASITALVGARVLIPDLVGAFDRLLAKGAAGDPQCWGKNALAKALKDLLHDESRTFSRGLQCVQMEPVWGGTADTAGTLRSICVLALLQCADLTREDKLWHMVRALSDAEPVVRLEATRALGEMDGREAALLLRLKARMGDKESSITGQALRSLLTIEREAAVPFVAEFLNSGGDQLQQEVQEEAALALGAFRQPGAVEALIEHWRNSKGVGVDGILRGISVSRQESSFEFLTNLVRESRERDALAALEALALHRDSADVRARVAEAVGSRGGSSLAARFKELFPAN